MSDDRYGEDPTRRQPSTEADAGLSGPVDAGDVVGEPERATLEQGLLETCIDVITDPVATLRAVTWAAPMGWSVIVLLVTGFLGGLGSDPTASFGGEELGGGGALSILGAILAAIVSLIGTAIGAAIIMVTSRMFGGRAGWRNLFAGGAFASVPGAFGVIGAAVAVLGTGGLVLAGLLSFVLGVWSLVLYVIAVREANRFSTGKAIGAVLIPFAVIVVLAVVAAVALFAAFSTGTSVGFLGGVPAAL